MNALKNTAISASAGTGKTYRLTHRYLALLAAGAPPEQICALTFSRKAAGEIFDRILQLLCGAASDPAERAKAEDTIARHEWEGIRSRSVNYTALLRGLVEKMPRLRVGTLDSFIVSVIRSFPLELGIPPDATPVDNGGGEAVAMRRAILSALAAPSGNPDSARAIMEAFRQATFGAEKTGINTALDHFAEDNHEFWRSHRNARWGDETAVWGDAPWWRNQETIGPDDIPADLEASLRSRRIHGTLVKSLLKVINDGLRQPAHVNLKTKVQEQVLSALASGHDCDSILYSNKDYALEGIEPRLLKAAVLNVVRIELARALEKTQGLHKILERYDGAYSARQNFDGKYTFGDMTALLGADGAVPSLTPSGERLYIDYRLDSKLDHWLLDEFQDTSDAQWNAIANLIDEVVQDESRSLFYVGDVKQSIYGWRGGNSELFGKILKEYGGSGERSVRKECISTCHRSLPAVIAAVNAVFNNLSGWKPSGNRERGLRQDAVNRFNDFWEKHESARKDEGEGFAQVREYEDSEDGEEADDPALYLTVADILNETVANRRGISAAVLVRSNEQGRACVQTLRNCGIDCVHEGVGGITDNPVVTLLLAVVRRAAHPGDTVADRHIKMSPLRDGADLAPLAVLDRLQRDGFAKTLREIAAGLPLADDAFGRQRLAELLSVAEAYDDTGDCDPDAFIAFIENDRVRSDAASGAVRVMTINQSKGLGFNVVIVPFAKSQKHSFANPSDIELLVDADGQWVLTPPKTEITSAEALCDGPLWRARESILSKANFGQLCVLYVALTRAEDALYLVVPKGKEKDIENNVCFAHDLVHDQLGADYVAGVGDSHWFEKFKKDQPETNTPAPKSDRPISESIPVVFEAEVKRFEPSKTNAGEFRSPASRLFDKTASDILVFGSEIHALFAELEWIEDADTEGIIARWRAASRASQRVKADVERQFRACLANPDIRAALSRPANAARTEVWREAPFSLALELDGETQLIGGRFDRLVLERGADGQAVSATILDYKSNQVDDPAAARKTAFYYAEQMSAYQKAAAKLLALPESAISAKLVFTRAGSVVDSENAKT
jgi:ATP-dependent exoDNAse (exonuclease V) beta subunit